MRLSFVQRKVEDGEKLRPEELALLRRAAEADAGPTLKLTLAHALSNAEEDLQALELLTRLKRDYPGDLPVLLGYARALAGLERYSEARAVVEEARRRHPDDPELHKVTALLALRRGEFQRAAHHAAEARRRDPFDVEARIIDDELEHAELPQDATPSRVEPPASKESFLVSLERALQRHEISQLKRGRSLWLRLPGGRVGRLDLDLLYSSYLEQELPVESVAEAFARELAGASELPVTKAELLERVRPVLRSASFLGRAKGCAHREGPAGLLVFHVLHDKDLVRYVPEGSLSSLTVTLEELDEAAWRSLDNLRAEPRPVIVDRGAPRLSPEPLGLWALAEADGYDASRLLCPTQQGLLAQQIGPGPYRVSLVRRELTLVCREDEAEWVAALDTLAPSGEGVPGRFRLIAGKGLYRLDQEPEAT
jgi:hypothetical protein